MEGRIRTRRTTDRETREAFIEAFQMCFPEDSMDTDGGFDKLFSIMPEALARLSYSLGNSTTNSNTTNTSLRNSLCDLPSPLELEMADQQVAITAYRQMLSYRHYMAPKFTKDQLRELKRFFKELANLFGPANIVMDGDKKSQTV